ncbi:glutamine--fructose-6-phosphate transaminase (isomerizing) [candidate division KSB1 bacterium]|nr:glutamine--fructose-6-phosphate transaminase (isomerizing) [candidate division KSB1 bacterium]
MCGIVGYIGKNASIPFLLNGLKRLEYRGYDSVGLAVHDGSKIQINKTAGRIAALQDLTNRHPLSGCLGIGHTRWATHGEPNSINAHPHTGNKNMLAIVHNGIIENFDLLKKELSAKGHTFKSDTDSEILAHLFEENMNNGFDLVEAVRQGLNLVKGTYGLAVICDHHPDMFIAARLGSPMVIGHGNGENYIASDAAPFIGYTKDVTYLDDGEIAVVKNDSVTVKTIDDQVVNKSIHIIDTDLKQIEKEGYSHYMLKEIMEQPQTLRNTTRGRLLLEEGTAKLGGLENDIESLLYSRRIIITACGTSWHAALLGEYMLEELVGIPVEVEYASEFRYRNPILGDDTTVIAISQSGETADTLAAIREARRKRSKVFGICNVVGSSIARETDAGVYLHAGPEIGVASTKAFTSQVTVLTLITLLLGRIRSISTAQGRDLAQNLQAIPQHVETVLKNRKQIEQIAKEFQNVKNFLYLGRGYNFPVALEGALKLKEISYIHAEGYPAAEMKHGPIALIDENMPVVVIAIKDNTYDKIISNIEEVKARKGRVIAIANEGDTEIANKADKVIYVPHSREMFSPLLTIIPLQLLAYYIAINRNCDVDQPRNLAKSVTVE